MADIVLSSSEASDSEEMQQELWGLLTDLPEHLLLNDSASVPSSSSSSTPQNDKGLDEENFTLHHSLLHHRPLAQKPHSFSFNSRLHHQQQQQGGKEEEEEEEEEEEFFPRATPTPQAHPAVVNGVRTTTAATTTMSPSSSFHYQHLHQQQEVEGGDIDDALELSRLRILHRAQHRKMQELQGELAACKTRMRDMAGEQDEARKRAHHEEAMLRRDLESTTAEMQRSRAELQRLQGEHAAATALVRELQHAQGLVRTDAVAAAAVIEDLHRQLQEKDRLLAARSTQALDEQIAAIALKKEQELAALQGEFDAYKREMGMQTSTLENQVATLTRHLEIAQQRADGAVAESKDAIDSLTAQLSRTQRRCQDLLADDRNTALQAAQAALTTTQASLSAEQGLTAELRDQVEDLKAQCQLLESSMTLGVTLDGRSLANVDAPAAAGSVDETLRLLRSELGKAIVANREKTDTIAKLRADLRALRQPRGGATSQADEGSPEMLRLQKEAAEARVKELERCLLEPAAPATTATATATKATAEVQTEVQTDGMEEGGLAGEPGALQELLAHATHECSALQDMNDALRAQVRDLQAEVDALREAENVSRDAVEELELMQEEVSRLRQENTALSTVALQLRDDALQDARAKLLADHKSATAHLEAQLEAAQNDVMAVQERYIALSEQNRLLLAQARSNTHAGEEIAAVRRECEAQVAGMEREHAQSLAAAVREREEALAHAAREHAEELARMQRAHEEALASAARHDSLRGELQRLQEEHTRSAAVLKEEFGRGLALRDAQHAAHVAALEREHEARLQQARTGSTQQREEIAAEYEGKIATMRREHQEEMDALRGEHAAALEAVAREAAELQSMQRDQEVLHATALQTLRAEMLLDKQRSIKDTREAMQRQLAALQQRNDDLHRSLEEASESLRLAESRLEDLGDDMEPSMTQESLDALMARMEQSTADALDDERRRAEMDKSHSLEVLRANYLDAAQRIREDVSRYLHEYRTRSARSLRDHVARERYATAVKLNVYYLGAMNKLLRGEVPSGKLEAAAAAAVAPADAMTGLDAVGAAAAAPTVVTAAGPTVTTSAATAAAVAPPVYVEGVKLFEPAAHHPHLQHTNDGGSARVTIGRRAGPGAALLKVPVMTSTPNNNNNNNGKTGETGTPPSTIRPKSKPLRSAPGTPQSLRV